MKKKKILLIDDYFSFNKNIKNKKQKNKNVYVCECMCADVPFCFLHYFFSYFVVVVWFNTL